MRLNRAEYHDAIAALQAGLTQLEPDGRPCAVCHDSDHQAGECHHNPLVLAKRYETIKREAGELHDHLHRLAL